MSRFAGDAKEFVPVVDLVREAKAGHHAIAAVNVFNMEWTQAVVEAGNEERSPFVLAFGPSAIAYCGSDFVRGLIAAASRLAEVPMGVHLDHGRKLEEIARAIRLGFTGVMFDGSHLPLEENIRRTREVVELARPFGVSVEGEVGRILGEEEGDIENVEAVPTDPEVASQFVEATGIDLLSVSVGTVHGMKYRRRVHIDVPLVKRIAEATPVPLALHGSFRTPDAVIGEAVEAGISKVNVALHYWEPFLRGVEDTIRERQEIVSPALVLSNARAKVREEIRHQFKVLKSCSKAS